MSAAALLEQVFSNIAATRMADVAICNPALTVEVVGELNWNGRYVAMLVTPWTISLVMLPSENGLDALALDEKQTWQFPSGSYDFMGLQEAELGPCHICPLISPVQHIASQQEAVDIAAEIMIKLFEPGQQQLRESQIEAARFNGEKILDQPLSRRDFLRGAFLGS